MTSRLTAKPREQFLNVSPFHCTDSAENQEVPVGAGGGYGHVRGQPRRDQEQIPEELGEGTREVRRFVPGGHADLQEPGGGGGGSSSADHVGQRGTGSGTSKHTDWLQYRRTKSGINQSWIKFNQQWHYSVKSVFDFSFVFSDAAHIVKKCSMKNQTLQGLSCCVLTNGVFPS